MVIQGWVAQSTSPATGGSELASPSQGELKRTKHVAASLDNLLEDLVLQHARAVEPELTDPSDSKRYEPYIGVHIRTPQLQEVGGRYVGARMTSRAAMLQYIVKNRHRVSLYVFDPKLVPLKAKKLAHRRVKTQEVYVGKVRGYSVAASEQSGVGYALASDLSDDKNTELLIMASR